MTATTTIVLYNEENKAVLGEVYAGQRFYIPETTSVFTTNSTVSAIELNVVPMLYQMKKG